MRAAQRVLQQKARRQPPRLRPAPNGRGGCAVCRCGLEAEQVALLRPVERMEPVAPQTGRSGPAAPDRGGGAVTEQTRAHQHAGVVVEIKRRRADFHRDARYRCLGPCCEQMAGGPQRRNRRTATETHQIVQNRVAAQTQLLRHITGDAGHRYPVQVHRNSASSWSGRSSA